LQYPDGGLLPANITLFESNQEEKLKEKLKLEQLKILKSSGIHEDTDIQIVDNEEKLFSKIIELIRNMDPDILIGYEIQNSSWGYLINRGKYQYKLEMVEELSRLPLENNSFKNNHDDYGLEHESGIHIKGRTILNLWRRMKIELKLCNYSIQSVALELLNRRIAKFSFEQLTTWFNSGPLRSRTVENFHNLSCLNLLLLDKLDLVRISAESARLYGLDYNIIHSNICIF
jgi:DNA polymerase zeta